MADTCLSRATVFAHLMSLRGMVVAEAARSWRKGGPRLVCRLSRAEAPKISSVYARGCAHSLPEAQARVQAREGWEMQGDEEGMRPRCLPPRRAIKPNLVQKCHPDAVKLRMLLS